MSTSAKQLRSNNSQAAKAILTQLYVTWASEPETMKLLKETMQEYLQSSRAPAGKANGKHMDPSKGLSSSDSPPATPPAKGVKGKGRVDEPRTPSPNATAAGPNPFRGVDELDYPHRAGSPGVTPSSPLAKPVIDPSAPLPQQHGAPGSSGGNSPLGAASTSTGSAGPAGSSSTFNTVSPPGAHSLGSASLDTSLNAAMVDVMPTNLDLSATVNKDSSVGRFVHSTGGYAASAPANVRRASLKDIPIFYTKKDSNGALDTVPSEEQQRLVEIIQEYSEGEDPFATEAARKRAAKVALPKRMFGDLCSKVLKVPVWMSDLVYKANMTFVDSTKEVNSVSPLQVKDFFNDKLGPLTPSRRMFELIRGINDASREYITIDDLKALVKYLVDAHPGLEFLQQPEFQDYYCRTVAIRIMYALERQQCRKIYWRDFDRSDLPEVMFELDTKDVNQVLEYFSYEHFYVLYCKFWELDTDRDLFVDFSDLCNYGQGSVVPRVIRRVVDGYGRPLTSGQPGRLDFEDFVYFCLSEEDKNSEPAVYYWFKVLDVDGDGILSGYELMEFYKENRQRFLEYSESAEGDIAYEDAMCQMLDMLGFDRVKSRKFGVTLGDLRACPTPANFFNMIFNAPKFMLFEHRDPFGEHQQKLRPEKTDWDRFARVEYDRMALEAQ